MQWLVSVSLLKTLIPSLLFPYPTYDTVCIVGSLFTDLVHEGLAKREDIIDISDIITGKHVGRESDDEIIIFSVGGMPVEDIAWGHEVYKNALANGIGVTLPLWDKQIGRAHV